MMILRQLGLGLLIAFVSIFLVLGALSMASAEGLLLATPTQAPTATMGIPVAGEDTPTPHPTATPIPPTQCPPPKGWEPIAIQEGDTLDTFAALYGLPKADIIAANCLISETLLPGSNLYVPPLPTPTNTPKPPQEQPVSQATATQVLPTVRTCGMPSGWTTYTVKSGDNLFRLSLAFGTTVARLMDVNCLPSTYIQAGQVIFVPNVATQTPQRTATFTKVPPTNTARPPTNTPVPPTNTAAPPTNTPVTPSLTPDTPTIEVPTEVTPDPTTAEPTVAPTT